ncbi:MAG: SPFH domain-containing protein [Pseudomonadota bacterium]
MAFIPDITNIIGLVILGLAIFTLYLSVKIVPQSQVYVVERFGKYTRTLTAGLSVITPFLDRVAHRVSILERQLPEFTISVITKDNVEVKLEATVFYRVTEASRTVYRIRNVDGALHTAGTSIVRSAAGKLELDDLQSSRESMNEEIATNLQEAANIWGIEITRTEITDVIIDEQTKEAQRQQLNAERERRAAIARAEGEKRSIELAADAKLYEAEKNADAVRIEADAQAYAVKVKAQADAEQTTLIAKAIENNGQPAVNFEVMKQQVQAVMHLASSSTTKTVVIPTDITGVLGSLQTIMASLPTQTKQIKKQTKQTNPWE